MADPARAHQVDQALAALNQRLDEFVGDTRTAINRYGYENAVTDLDRFLQRGAARAEGEGEVEAALSALAAAANARLAQQRHGGQPGAPQNWQVRRAVRVRVPALPPAGRTVRGPAAVAIDWTNPGRRIGDRAKPLAPNAINRIQAGLDMFAEPTMVTVNHSGDAGRHYPAARAPLPARTVKIGDGIASPPFLMLL